MAEVVGLVGLYKELRVSLHLLFPMHYDNKSAIQIATNLVFYERTKYIDIDCHFIRENIHQCLVDTIYVPSSEQHADILIKGLTIAQHFYLLSKLGMTNIFIFPSLRGGCVCMEELDRCTTMY